MVAAQIPRVMIAGTGSGCGKTTVSCAILRALVVRGVKARAFKCGPDYIDPMFHKDIVATNSSNLDIYLNGEENTGLLLAENSAGAQISVIEGVMGFYDGLGGDTTFASSFHLSDLTRTPVVLVADAKGASLSICATIKGFYDFTPNKIGGVILNRCTAGFYPVLKETIERRTGVKVFGYLPPMPGTEISSRHLGLVTAAEIGDLRDRVAVWGDAAEKNIDIDGLTSFAESAPELSYRPLEILPLCKDKKIAVAYDEAFCFYYHDSLRLLEKLGASLRFFSPLTDSCLPDDTHGLILGGGYPENHAERLSENTAMLCAIKSAIDSGVPTVAECGGFMYLHEKMCGKRMVGAIGGEARMTSNLNRFGYIELTANADNLLCKKGEVIRAHEFHYSDSQNPGTGFTAKKSRGKPYACIHAGKNLFAGYPHISLWGNVNFAENFIKSL